MNTQRNITAIGATTMESGAIIGNSLKTLYSRITTLPASTKILQSVGIAVTEIGESGEQVKPVTQILGELAGKWNYLSDSQRQNIGVQIAG